jgi:hypothetical protein
VLPCDGQRAGRLSERPLSVPHLAGQVSASRSACGNFTSLESLSGGSCTVCMLLVFERAAVLRACVDLAAGTLRDGAR